MCWSEENPLEVVTSKNHIIICCFQFHSSDFDASALWKHSEKKSTNFRHSSAFNIPLFFISKATNKFQKVLCKFDNNPTFSCVKSNFLSNFISQKLEGNLKSIDNFGSEMTDFISLVWVKFHFYCGDIKISHIQQPTHLAANLNLRTRLLAQMESSFAQRSAAAITWFAHSVLNECYKMYYADQIVSSL